MSSLVVSWILAERIRKARYETQYLRSRGSVD